MYIHPHLHNCLLSAATPTEQRHLLLDRTNTAHDSIRPLLASLHKNGLHLHICYENRSEMDTLHTKSTVIDKTILWRGSANWSLAADTANREEITRIHCPKIAAFYHDALHHIAKIHCRKATKRDFKE